ncbi:MAG TPA: T9SS type A sorting domain-containing protein [Bacteroidales bacterium]|nr:T9SS type A sorting domain-containing protein [Bacteroidales bacterium]HPB26207.1 T9SS type A sorting domain-containing protein [Bacteroidales bacterium]HPI30424.1 T9SS type A sorting domain-containing protein [Bacteroidales bacterium]HQN17058.1 T9SS type A sorting domain-containing protein [Bacteroidales bacterium]HQP16018.1 T9SS type A sorting domain-containing protein [Bacteroidales bacterium]
MKKFPAFFWMIFSVGMAVGQSNYNHGNEAYINEKWLGFNPVTIKNGSAVYNYDTFNKVYRCGDHILIPDKTSIPDGKRVHVNAFFGYGVGGNISDTAFNWDNQTILTPNDFNRRKLFVSPVSDVGMTYAAALQYNSPYCNYDDCFATIDGPVSGLAYPTFLPDSGIYDIWDGEELINAGDLKNTGTLQKVSQQQTLATANRSYCVNKYGEGWRLPTDMEVGHFNDNEGTGWGLDSAYMGISPYYIWTSSLYKIYTVKRWATRITDGYWENCGGFLYTTNHLRCVFEGVENTSTKVEEPLLIDEKIVLFPNPCKELLIIKNISGATVKIYNSQGVEVLTDGLSSSQRTFDLGCCPNGLYFVRIISGENQLIRKLIMAR